MFDDATFTRRFNVRTGLTRVGLRTARAALKSAGVALPRGSSRWARSAQEQWVHAWLMSAPAAEVDGVHAFFRQRALDAKQARDAR